ELHDYLLSGSPQPLAQYVESRMDTEEALKALRRETSGTPDSRQVDKIEAGARSWESWAEGMRQRGPTAFQGTRGSAIAQQGTDLFGGFHDPLEELKGRVEKAVAAESVALQRSLAISTAVV